MAKNLALNSERGRILLLELAVWIEDGRWQSQFQHRRRADRGGSRPSRTRPPPQGSQRGERAALHGGVLCQCSWRCQGSERLKKLIDCCEKLRLALGAIRDAEAMAEFLESTVGINTAAGCLAKTAILSSGQPWRAEDGAEKHLKGGARLFAIVRDRGILRPWRSARN